MIVETKIVGTSGTESVQVSAAVGPRTLRELLEVLVDHELARYETAREASRTWRVLTPADLARGVESGSYGRERRAVPAAPPREVAIARALEAFGDELFFVFLDDDQVTELDAELLVREDSTLRLVRLVALAGG